MFSFLVFVKKNRSIFLFSKKRLWYEVFHSYDSLLFIMPLAGGNVDILLVEGIGKH